MANSQTSFSNGKTAHQYVDEIKAEIASTNTAWVKVAKLLHDAVGSLGEDSRSLKFIQKELKFGKAKTSKFVTIGRSDRFDNHAAKFANVEGWTVLYQIATLSDDEFDSLQSGVKAGQVVTGAMINRIKGVPTSKVSSGKILASIKIDADELVLRNFTLEHWSELVNSLEKLASEIPTLRIEFSDTFTKAQGQFDEEVSEAVLEIQTDEFIECYRQHLTRNGLSEPFKKVGAIRRSKLWDDRAFLDAWGIAKENPEKGFSAIGAEYNSAMILQKAVNKVMQKRKVNKNKQ